jgi:uncharacterized alkaline shock family protein YloU
MDLGHPRISDIAVAQATAEAVCAVPGVADLSPGRVVEVATYGPGQIVRGVAVNRTDGALRVAVHFIAVFAPSLNLPALADRVRRAVTEVVENLGAGPVERIDVTVDDLRREEG